MVNGELEMVNYEWAAARPALFTIHNSQFTIHDSFDFPFYSQ